MFCGVSSFVYAFGVHSEDLAALEKDYKEVGVSKGTLREVVIVILARVVYIQESIHRVVREKAPPVRSPSLALFILCVPMCVWMR